MFGIFRYRNTICHIFPGTEITCPFRFIAMTGIGVHINDITSIGQRANSRTFHPVGRKRFISGRQIRTCCMLAYSNRQFLFGFRPDTFIFIKHIIFTILFLYGHIDHVMSRIEEYLCRGKGFEIFCRSIIHTVIIFLSRLGLPHAVLFDRTGPEDHILPVFVVVNHFGSPAVPDFISFHHFRIRLARPVYEVFRMGISDCIPVPVQCPDTMPKSVRPLHDKRITHTFISIPSPVIAFQETMFWSYRHPGISICTPGQMHTVAILILICKISEQITYIGRRGGLCQRKYSRQQEQD